MEGAGPIRPETGRPQHHPTVGLGPERHVEPHVEADAPALGDDAQVGPVEGRQQTCVERFGEHRLLLTPGGCIQYRNDAGLPAPGAARPPMVACAAQRCQAGTCTVRRRRGSTDADHADGRLRFHRLGRDPAPDPRTRPQRRQRRPDDLRRLRGRAGGGAATIPATRWCAPTSPTRGDAAVFADAPAGRGDAPGGRDPCGPLDRRPGGVHPDQRRRHLRRCWRRRARYWSALPAEPKAAFRFHHVSTDEVFGALEPDDPPFTETTPYDPRSPYSASKAASDHLVRAWYHTYGLPTFVTNTTNNYGSWQFPEKLIPLVTLNAIEGRELPVYGDGSNERDWLFVEDHAEALVRAVERASPARPTPSAPASRAPTCRWCSASAAAGRAAARSGRPARAADPLRHRPARPRFPLRDRPSRAERGARLARRRTTSTAGCAARCSGISTTAPGGRRSAPAATPGSDWEPRHAGSPETRHEGHPARRRLRHPAAPDDAGRSQAAAAGLRQADDLLPAVAR